MLCEDFGGPLLKSLGWIRSVLLTLSLANICWSRVLDYKSSTVCDGDAKIISCPRNQLIHVLQSFYGKWSNHDCHGPLQTRDNIPTCKVDREKSTAIIRDICQGQNSCNLYADDTIYGDPCPKNKKYLYVTYFCMARGGHPRTAPPEPAHPTVRLLTEAPTLKLDMDNKSKPTARQSPLPSESIRLESTQSELPIGKHPVEVVQTKENTTALGQDSTPKAVMMNSVSRHNIQKTDQRNISEELSDVVDELQNAPQILTSPFYRVISMALNTLSSTPSPVSVITVCNGERKTISCRPPQRLKTQYAFYGKKNGHDCHGLLPYKDESPTCSALDAKYTVQSTCDGRPTCLLYADENTYGRSLCPSVNKYLHVTYICQEPPMLSAERSTLTPSLDYEEDAVSRSKIKLLPGAKQNVRVCNGMRRTISCPVTRTMTVHEAFYGKKRGEECRGKLSYRDSVPNCKQSSALDSVRFLCHGRQSCDLAAESALFGDDPCPGVNKYLEVVYSC